MSERDLSHAAQPLTCVFARLAASLCALGLALASPATASELEEPSNRAALSAADTSGAAGQLLAWVSHTDDNQGLPFVIVDKIGARALAFDSQSRLVAIAPVLLGLARGDESPPGIGERPLSNIGPELRITPAGRFVAELGVNLAGHTILWVDFDTALSLHPVVTGNLSDHRRERLASPTVGDNRISYGCINVPPAFFEDVVRPLFGFAGGIVYILPETRSLEDVFLTADR